MNYLNKRVKMLTALKVKLSGDGTFYLGAPNFREETLMLNDIRSKGQLNE